ISELYAKLDVVQETKKQRRKRIRLSANQAVRALFSLPVQSTTRLLFGCDEENFPLLNHLLALPFVKTTLSTLFSSSSSSSPSCKAQLSTAGSSPDLPEDSINFIYLYSKLKNFGIIEISEDV
uniref:Uncharacterized protein n=1 Tax=Romanomermis culicivorax TaxID=13658 RepID=A0A915JKF9_ROMCU